MKKWISRSIVLAMIIALMVPMPVAAKSKKGGKLVKSVTEYYYNTNANRWQKDTKTDYTYDKKNNPVQIAETEYYSYFMGIPTRGRKNVETVKYKYKGKKVKSAKAKDSAGFVTESCKYSKGMAVSGTTIDQYSYFDSNKVEQTEVENMSWTATFNKEGLATGGTYASTTTYSNGTAPEVYSGSVAYTVTHSKGIPSLITATYGPVTIDTKTYPGDTSPSAYAKFDGKGLVVESGYITKDAAGAEKYIPDQKIEYTYKKGVAKTAVVSEVVTDENGNITKVTPSRMYSFKYTKKKASAVRYLSMVNNLIGYKTGMGAAYFDWY